MLLRIEEAIAVAKLSGRKVNKIKIARTMYPSKTYRAATVRFQKLLKGEVKRIEPQWVLDICEICGVTPNFLFGYENVKISNAD